MKKFTVLFLAVISLLAFVLTGCTDGEAFTGKSYISGETEIKSVTVQVTDREIDISASQDNRIYIDYFDGEKEYLDITVSEGHLTVKTMINKEWTDFIGVKPSAEYRKIKIAIPDGLLSSLLASTTNENIKVTELSFTEQIDLDVNGGDIECERVSVGKSISLKAKNGDITGSVIGGWDDFSIACKIKKGDCNLPELKEDGEKLLSADCNNGDINIKFVK